MRRSKHMAKRAMGLKILKIIIILAITFLAGIVVTFCQKQSKPVVTDENRTTQTTSSRVKKHKKSKSAKKETGKETKVSVTINTPADKNNNKDKKAGDENGLTPAEAEYYKKHHLNPQPETDPLEDGDHYMGEFYSDDSEEEPEYKTNDNDNYYVPNTTVNKGESTASSSSMKTTADNTQSSSNNNQGVGNYGNN